MSACARGASLISGRGVLGGSCPRPPAPRLIHGAGSARAAAAVGTDAGSGSRSAISTSSSSSSSDSSSMSPRCSRPSASLRFDDDDEEQEECVMFMIVLLWPPPLLMLLKDAHEGVRKRGKLDEERNMVSKAVVDGLYV